MQALVFGSMYGAVAGQLLLFPVVQSALHPSPSILLPSSHCSVPTRMPSPQTELQVLDKSTKPRLQLVQVALETGQEAQLATIQGTTSQRKVVVFTIYPGTHSVQAEPVGEQVLQLLMTLEHKGQEVPER